jgi:hypothetical protein
MTKSISRNQSLHDSVPDNKRHRHLLKCISLKKKVLPVGMVLYQQKNYQTRNRWLLTLPLGEMTGYRSFQVIRELDLLRLKDPKVDTLISTRNAAALGCESPGSHGLYVDRQEFATKYDEVYLCSDAIFSQSLKEFDLRKKILAILKETSGDNDPPCLFCESSRKVLHDLAIEFEIKYDNGTEIEKAKMYGLLSKTGSVGGSGALQIPLFYEVEMRDGVEFQRVLLGGYTELLDFKSQKLLI